MMKLLDSKIERSNTLLATYLPQVIRVAVNGHKPTLDAVSKTLSVLCSGIAD
jgi:hypothetical protein